MRTITRTSFPSIAATLLVIATTISSLPAQSVGEEPVGFSSIKLLHKSDTILAVPLARSAEFVGSGRLSVTKKNRTAVIDFDDSPFQAGQFGSRRCYARLESGNRNGAFYTIASNDTDSLTLELDGDTPAESKVSVRIVRYWTLGTLFPTSLKLVRTTVLIPDNGTSDLKDSGATKYTYRLSAKKWVRAGSSASANETILRPDTCLVVRNKGTTKILILEGTVVTGKLVIPVKSERGANTKTFAALMRPTDTTLGSSGLRRVVRGADRVLVFDNTRARLNKKPSAVYRFAGGSWRRLGSQGNAGGDNLVEGAGIVVEKAAGKSRTAWWTNSSPYSF